MKQDKSIARPIVTLSLVILLQIAAFTAQAPVVSAKQPECYCNYIKPVPMQATKLSFAATEYKNSEYGFKVRYPTSWRDGVWGNAESDRQAGMLLVALGAGTQRLVVGARQGATLADALAAVFKDSGAGNTIIERSADTRLTDGTPATWIAYFTELAGTPLAGVAVGAKKEDTWVFVAVSARKASGMQALEAAFLGIGWDGALFTEILSTLEFEYNYEFVRTEQVVDVLSAHQALVTWRVDIRNNGLRDMGSIRYRIRLPYASLTVTRAYDSNGDIRFAYLTEQPISPGEPDDSTVLFYFRRSLRPGDTYSFTMELTATHVGKFEFAEAICQPWGTISRAALLSVVAPSGYTITRTEPADAPREMVDGREAIKLAAENATSMRLVAYLAEPEPEPAPVSIPPVLPEEQPVMPILGVLDNVPIAIYAAIGGAIGLVAIVFILRQYRKRRAEAWSRDIEAYEKKLAQWEKEGYDVRKIREKLRKAKK